ncbi:HECT-domain-containing protein [Coccomyxa subellipsoidea C-169]|uniref:HECT-type E3 ubiquitin transferase n=1 Tax=Coccomyxa subellipsoidea (strain C-169) TaxID=574566 RepID=I0YP53_COCSC|nr:HECT-domain-containing protein [Coccomyxa subellipsoidea C-169]EIE20172.1 HECT-domain-containing protein [Coccomyxa subellipsoidea C-169]|eukprot:XP_005644716.1 HECT-domain-containing protein [Coccomyxa subellipsoidea C-169]
MRRRSSTSVSMDLSLAPVTSEETPFQSASPDGKPLEAQLPFLRFAERHRRLVNVLIQQNVQLLLEGPLTQLMRTPRLIDFDNKRAFFRSQVRSASDRYHGSLRIHVRREHIFEDSFHQLRSKTPEEMRGKLSVQFHSEEGIDAGGVTREWYQVMARETFNPNISLFVPTGGSTFQPNPNSIVQNDEARGTNHLDFFKFVGRVVGKALYDGQLIDAYFTRSFYKHMLGQPLTYQDIEGVDPEYFKNLTWLLEHDMTDVVDLNFVEEVDYFGRVEHVELKPGGRDIKVTNENKREYVDLVAEHRMTTAIRAQIQAFLKGFWEMVPRDLISMFNDHELELLISGLPEIDVDDLRANTDYHGYSPASPVIQYFWEVVREMDKEDLALLVQFVTGTSKVPLEGFKALQGIGGPQKFQIHKAYGSQQKLPAAHTCFNQLDLVEYESKEQLRDRLMLALHEGATGFGFG